MIILSGGSLRADLPAAQAITNRALLDSNGLEVPLGLAGLDAGALERLLEKG